MAIESSGQSKGNPRMAELIAGAPKTGKSPTIWAWPQITSYLGIASQPVAGPWPPHQEPRPDPTDEALPVAVAEPEPEPRPEVHRRPGPPRGPVAEPVVAPEPEPKPEVHRRPGPPRSW